MFKCGEPFDWMSHLLVSLKKDIQGRGYTTASCLRYNIEMCELLQLQGYAIQANVVILWYYI